MAFLKKGWFKLRLSNGGPLNVDQNVGATLKYYRLHLGESEQVIADLLCVTRRDLIRLEQGQKRVSAAGLFVLAKRFNVSVSEFFQPIGRFS